MEASVAKYGFHVYHGESGENALIHGFHHALLYRREILPWHLSSNNLGAKLEPCGALHRLQPDDYMAVLTVTTGLLFVPVLGLDGLGDGLFVGDLGHLHFQVGAKLAAYLVHGNVDLGVSQSGDQRFRSIGVA